jgi:hypothetical protein
METHKNLKFTVNYKKKSLPIIKNSILSDDKKN